MKPLRLMLAAAALSWAAVAGAVGWVGIPLRNGPEGSVEVPDVVGLDAADADTALEAVGLDTGVVTMSCSLQPADEVLEQDPIAGALVDVGSLVDLETSDGVECTYDLTGIPDGWYSIANVLVDQEFLELMRIEATTGGADWAYFLFGTTQGSANLRLDMAIITDEANGTADWARWAPDTQPGNTGNLQLHMLDALAADFL